MRPINEENGYFSKVSYKGGGYQEGIKYITTQPLDSRKKGFGTKDASKRDEFSNIIRTEQYRETLRKEQDVCNLNSEKLQEELDMLMATRVQTAPTFNKTVSSDSSEFSYDSHVALYDIGRTRVTPFNPKSIKDSFYRFSSDRQKRLGTFRPSSCDFGDFPSDIGYKPPEHGARSEVKNFFDKSHLFIPVE